MTENARSMIGIMIFGIFIRILLFPFYHSTDFEVHRNWLAITYSLPLSEWYFDQTSIWTLDYPPFFAYFEFILSRLAAVIDVNIVDVNKLNYDAWSVILFQRCSVICCDIFYMLMCWKLIAVMDRSDFASKAINQFSNKLRLNPCLIIFTLSCLNAGLIIVDNIHFQYNSLMLGILIYSISCAFTKSYLHLTFAFSILILMKHLFITLIPVYAVFLLRTYCRIQRNNSEKFRFSIGNFLTLVAIALFMLTVAFGPFFAQGFILGLKTGGGMKSGVMFGFNQLKQIAMRLFPFGRGLVHAYWAPNIWALYCGVDKFLTILRRHVLASLNSSSSAFEGKVASGLSSTAGLVGEFNFNVLPQISPLVALSLTFLAQLPILLKIYRHRRPSADLFLRSVIYCSFSAFMFARFNLWVMGLTGYHVHEKAILIPLILMGFISVQNYPEAELYLQVAMAGQLGLLPLLMNLKETGLKVMLYLSHFAMAWRLLTNATPIELISKRILQGIFLCCLLIVTFAAVIHPIMFVRFSDIDVTAEGTGKTTRELFLPFLPLMITSLACGMLLTFAWVQSFLIVNN